MQNTTCRDSDTELCVFSILVGPDVGDRDNLEPLPWCDDDADELDCECDVDVTGERSRLIAFIIRNVLGTRNVLLLLNVAVYLTIFYCGS